jgi:hypothetical protein
MRRIELDLKITLVVPVELSCQIIHRRIAASFSTMILAQGLHRIFIANNRQ